MYLPYNGKVAIFLAPYTNISLACKNVIYNCFSFLFSLCSSVGESLWSPSTFYQLKYQVHCPTIDRASPCHTIEIASPFLTIDIVSPCPTIDIASLCPTIGRASPFPTIDIVSWTDD